MPGPSQDPQRRGLVLQLASLVLARDHHACGQVGDPDGGVGGVDALPAGVLRDRRQVRAHVEPDRRVVLGADGVVGAVRVLLHGGDRRRGILGLHRVDDLLRLVAGHNRVGVAAAHAAAVGALGGRRGRGDRGGLREGGRAGGDDAEPGDGRGGQGRRGDPDLLRASHAVLRSSPALRRAC